MHGDFAPCRILMIAVIIEKVIFQIRNIIKKGFFAIFLTSVVTSILNFFASTVIVRFVSKTEFGIYTYANNQLSFFLLLSGLGVGSGILQLCSEVGENTKEAKSLYNFGCKVGIGFNFFLAIIIVVYTYVANFPISDAKVVLFSMCLIPLATILPQLQTSYLRSRIKNKEFACASIVRAGLSCLLLIVGSYFFKVQGLIAGTYLTGILTSIFVAYKFNVPIMSKYNTVLTKVKKRELIKISSISMINNALSGLLYLLDVFLIAMFIGSEEVIASYKVATVIPTGLIFIPSAIVTFIYPYFARNRENKKWVKNNYIRVIWGSLLVDGSIGVGLFMIAPWLVTFLFGSNYADAVLSFRILLIGFIFSGTFRVISGNLLVTQRQLTFNTIVAVISGAFNIIADIVLIKHYGSVGAAIATVVVQMISGVLNTSRMFWILNRSNK